MSSAVGADTLPSDPACLDQFVLMVSLLPLAQPMAMIQEKDSISQKPLWTTEVHFVHAPNISSSNEATVKDSEFHLSFPLTYWCSSEDYRRYLITYYFSTVLCNKNNICLVHMPTI